MRPMARAPAPTPAVTRALRGPLVICALLSIAGCGVAGRPLPPGPTPPAAPLLAAPTHTPDGVHLTLAAPLRDLDDRPVDGPVELWAYAAPRAEDCAGSPMARGPLDGLTVPADRLDGPLRVVAVREGRIGEPSAPLSVTWVAPPPAPEAPLAFVDAGGQVQLSWLPPEPPITEVEIRRDGAAVARAPAEAALWSERPGPGAHRYTLVGLAPGARTAASAAAVVDVPADLR